MQMVAGRKSQFRLLPLLLATAVALPTSLSMGSNAYALSQLQQAPAEQPATGTSGNNQAPSAPAAPAAPADSGGTITMPAPLVDSTKATAPAVTTDSKPAEIMFDISKAPEAVRKTRDAIIEAAKAGDLKKVAELMHPGPNHTDIGPDDSGNDIPTALKDMSGDGDGLEILSIMLDILSTGFAHVNAGTPDEAYVWPYFAEKKLDQLTAPEKVDLMRIVTAGDFADMQEYGGYNFYRIAITPDGHWKSFLSGN